MTDPHQSRSPLPHWGWFLLATVVLVVVSGALSVWLPYYRERQVIQKIEVWGGSAWRETCGPEWLQKLLGKDRMKGLKVFERRKQVFLGGTGFPDEGIADLSGLKNLGILDLSGTKVTDASLVHLTGLKNPGFLYLKGTAVTDAGLAHLSGLTNLHNLNLTDTGVTDAGLAHLSRLKNLVVLGLDGTAVTDAGLAHLSGLKNLADLDLGDTAVTGKGIDKLREALPDCEIERSPRWREPVRNPK